MSVLLLFDCAEGAYVYAETAAVALCLVNYGLAVLYGDGGIQQVAPPLEVYERPANPFVAGFIGTPAMNLFPPGTLHKENTVGLRPEHIALAEAGEGPAAVVDFVEPLGPETLVHLLLADGGHRVIARVPGFAPNRPGDRVVLKLSFSHAVEFA